MNNIVKLLSRYFKILILSFVLLLIFNLTLFSVINHKELTGGHPWITAKELSDSLTKINGTYHISNDGNKLLTSESAWAILIDNDHRQVVWKSQNTPDFIPDTYSFSEISLLSRGYLKDYPAFTAVNPDGLLIVCYPKKSYWKLLYNSWDYHFIRNLPRNLLLFAIGNVIVIFLLYTVCNTHLIRSISPIIRGIQALPAGEKVSLPEKGLLSDLCRYINEASSQLQVAKEQIKKKDCARANWIAGVSHDIRTPLTMIMGYAAQLEESDALSIESRSKTAGILRQSQRMKDLINDLNLASKLDYDMQPIKLDTLPILSILRQAAADFMNLDIEGDYPVELSIPDSFPPLIVNCDPGLIHRAIMNLLNNSKNHNENGCNIYITIEAQTDSCLIAIEDDGAGCSLDEIERLNHAPHYMVCDDSTSDQRHGLGLLIVKQIILAHHGQTNIRKSHTYGGFCVQIELPCQPYTETS